jgi:hypothetical protein
VFVGTILALFAGIIALYNGAILIGTIIILISSFIFGFWLIVVILSAYYNIQLPKVITKLVSKFLSQERSDKIIHYTNTAISDLCTMSRNNFNSRRTIKIFFVGMVLTFFAFACLGASFLVLGGLIESDLGLYDSILATAASTELGSLPITVGGSGLTEIGLWAYVSGLNNLPSLNEVLKDSHLDVIISWRIASYHIPLMIMWIVLMRLTLIKKNYVEN